jgi:hypothetical protein
MDVDVDFSITCSVPAKVYFTFVLFHSSKYIRVVDKCVENSKILQTQWAPLNGITNDNGINRIIQITGSFSKSHFLKLSSLNGKGSSDNVIINSLAQIDPIKWQPLYYK